MGTIAPNNTHCQTLNDSEVGLCLANTAKSAWYLGCWGTVSRQMVDRQMVERQMARRQNAKRQNTGRQNTHIVNCDEMHTGHKFQLCQAIHLALHLHKYQQHNSTNIFCTFRGHRQTALPRWFSWLIALQRMLWPTPRRTTFLMPHFYVIFPMSTFACHIFHASV